MTEPYVALQVVMMPRDANPLPTYLIGPGNTQFALYGTIFGGVILSYIDQAGAIGARHAIAATGRTPPLLVTVALNRVEFKQPVHVGDVVRFLTHPLRIGRTSITIHVDVEAERAGQPRLHVTEAEIVYVGIDAVTRRPTAILDAQAQANEPGPGGGKTP